MVQGELEWLNGLIEADQPNRARSRACGAQHRHGIGRRAQANVPNHEFAVVLPQAPRQTELADIEGLGLRHWPDDWMKRLAMRERVDAMGAVGQLNQAI